MKLWRQASPFGEVTVVVSDAACARSACPATINPMARPARPIARVARQLDDWFAGKRHAFDLALDLDGIEGFRRTALETLAREVGWGETVTYGELADLAGRPRGRAPPAARSATTRCRS